jgi:dCMP deaminase
MRESWPKFFMSLARMWATRSRDTTQVGCVVVDDDKVVRSAGYNGLPREVRDLPERLERPAKYLWTAHAELNAITNAARVGTSLKGCTMYVTNKPCSRCAGAIVNAGIRRVIYGENRTSMPAEEFEIAERIFEEANVHVLEETLVS